jgi:TonB family protein
MVHWMAYCLAVGALLSAAALAMEAALRAFRRPARWVWAAALALSIGIPGAVRWVPRAAESASSVAPVTPLASGTASPAPVAPVAAARPPVDLHALDRPLLAGWVGLSIGVALAWLAAWSVLQWRRRRWRERKVDGVRVLVSADTGPAVVGWIRPRIVLPEWVVRDADPSVRRMILQHETEHLVSGDPRMLAFALAAVALVPWSPAAWWQLRRLRLAMEVDCDARVLARRADVRAYGELLLEVGRRGAGTRLPVAAMSEPRSFLERRIRMMTQRTHPRRIRTSLSLVAFAVVALAGMQALPVPAVPAADAQVLPAGARAAHDTVQPEITNLQQVMRAMNDHYPALLRAAGISGTVVVSVRVTPEGAVTNPVVVESSDPRFSEAALRVIQIARFQPARAEGRAVPFTISFPLVFPAGPPTRGGGAGGDLRPTRADAVGVTVQPAAGGADSGDLRPARAGAAGADLRPVPVHPEPAPTPSPDSEPDMKPVLVNDAEIGRALEHEYPQRLRGAGITLQARVRVRVAASGAMEHFEVVSASHPEAAVAVEQVFRRARFRPARQDGKWVASDLELSVGFRGGDTAMSPRP